MTISKPAEKPGSGVEIHHSGPYPLAVGETVAGPGIAPGTRIAAIKAGEITLSEPATAAGTGVLLHAGLPAAVPAAALRGALEGLSSIGPHGVRVSGGPGDGAGSSPYQLTFTGALENTDVKALTTEDLGLSGGAASATVQSLHDGGGGFDQGASEAPPGGGALGGTAKEHAVATLTGLSPDSGYRYRVLATSHCSAGEPEKLCPVSGPTRAFHTYPLSGALPDRRVYELVSPVQKLGGQVLPADPRISSCGIAECKPGGLYQHFPMQSTDDGNAIVYEGTPFSAEGGAAIENEYRALRTPSGWQSTNLTPPLLFSKGGGGYKAFSADLGQGLLESQSPALTPQAPAGYTNLYTQPAADPTALGALLQATPPNRPATGLGRFQTRYGGASADLSRVFFAANDALTANVPGIAPAASDFGADKRSLYEWSAGALHLVNVKPGNSETRGGQLRGREPAADLQPTARGRSGATGPGRCMCAKRGR